MNAMVQPVRTDINATHRITLNLEEIGRFLRNSGYSFTAVTPETHRRVMANNPTCSDVLRDIFGWNRSFAREDIDESIFQLLIEADGAQPVERSTALHRSRVRFASLGEDLFAHSAFPTDAADSVFFGPDTYRFASLIQRVASHREASTQRIIDIGCGSGAGAVTALRATCASAEIVLADINGVALSFAEANAAIAGVKSFKTVLSDVFADIDGTADLIISNPPYLCDPKERMYRHGGNLRGAELSLRILRESLPRLRSRGQLILYTGTAIVDGADTFKRGALPLLSSADYSFQYDEIDPDVFGEELDRKQYEHVERIAAIGLVVTRLH
jgi:release factor glutamine methyltransferase